MLCSAVCSFLLWTCCCVSPGIFSVAQRLAEVAKGLRLEQLMRTMVDVCDVRGADPELVAELRAMADARALHDGGVRDAEVAAGGEEAAQPGFWGRLIGRGS